MENINIYIQEKLKINSKSKISTKNIQEEYCIAIAYSELYEEFCEYFEDCLVRSEICANCFIVEPYEIQNFWNHPDLDIFRIPDNYTDIDKVAEDYESGKLDSGELEKFDTEKYLKENT